MADRRLYTLAKRIILRFVGLSRFDLIYTNPSPTAEFGAEKVSVPGITDYDFIVLLIYSSTSNSTFQMVFLPAVEGKSCNIQRHYNVSSDNVPGFSDRAVTVNGDGLTFTTCRHKSVNATSVSSTYAKTWTIPYKAYGIKLIGGGTA